MRKARSHNMPTPGRSSLKKSRFTISCKRMKRKCLGVSARHTSAVSETLSICISETRHKNDFDQEPHDWTARSNILVFGNDLMPNSYPLWLVVFWWWLDVTTPPNSLVNRTLAPQQQKSQRCCTSSEKDLDYVRSPLFVVVHHARPWGRIVLFFLLLRFRALPSSFTITFVSLPAARCWIFVEPLDYG